MLETADYGIEIRDLPPYEDGRIDPRGWFTMPKEPLEIEIGSGKGTFLVQQAPLTPEVNYLGIEWAGEFYRHAADRIRRRGIDNARILRSDAAEFLRYYCADAVTRAVHVYFSDPWPKRRHHKRRVVQDRTLLELHRVLEPEGVVHLVTDHADLWSWYEQYAERHRDRFVRQTFVASASAKEGEVVGTNFERKYRREGRPFHGMTLLRL